MNKLINICCGYKIMVGIKWDSVVFDVYVVFCYWKFVINVLVCEKVGGVYSEVKFWVRVNDEWI